MFIFSYFCKKQEERKMKGTSFFVLLIVITGLLSCTEDKYTAATDSQLKEMRSTATEFMKELKGILIKEIQQGGILSAVAVCSDTAQLLTNDYGLQRGVFVRRVSFKNRNEGNSPDEYEKHILNKFQVMKNGGKLTENPENIEIIIEDESKFLRYMKPIFIQAECLNCHGSETDIQKETRELIAEKYPNDKAIDYKLGDLRGAVSVKKVIE
jgi:hypothetical protein